METKGSVYMKFDETQKNYIYYAMTLILFVSLVFSYGLIPGYYVSSFCSTLGIQGSVDCVLNNGILSKDFCSNVGMDLGFPFLSGLPLIYFSAILSRLFGFTTEMSITIAGVVLLFTAFFSLKSLLDCLGSHRVFSVFGSFLFLNSFIVWGQSYGPYSYSYLMYGFVLLPFYLLVDYKFFTKYNGECFKISYIFYVSLYVSVKWFSVFLDGYSFVIAAMASLGFFGVFLLKNFKNIKNIFIKSSIFLFANASAVYLYKLYVPQGAKYPVMPIDFFRGQGVDVVSLFLPGSDLWYAKIFGLATNWNSMAPSFYGDGSNVRYNYLGYVLILIFLYFLFLVKSKNSYLKGLVAVGIFSLFLSLGPSLKINDVRQSVNTIEYGYDDYIMPESAATLTLYSDFVYRNIPGIKNMRAVHRWLILFKFTLIVCAAVSLSYLYRTKSRKVAVVLGVLCFLELLSDPLSKHESFRNWRNQMVFFESGVLSDFKKSLSEGDRIFYLSKENDFLSWIFSPTANVKSYNIGGDKNIELSENTWPFFIKNMRKMENINENAYIGLTSGKLDAIVIPYFNMRWDSYNWPPSNEKIEINKKAMNDVFDYKDQKFVISDYKWFSVVRLNKDKYFFNFIEKFDECKKTGETSREDNPWRKSIAKIKNDDGPSGGSKYSVFSVPETGFECRVELPQMQNLYLLTSIGNHPLASEWGGDGFRMTLEVSSENSPTIKVDEYIKGDGLLKKIQVPLDKLSGKTVKFRFSTTNDVGKNAVADWPIWVSPQISSMSEQ